MVSPSTPKRRRLIDVLTPRRLVTTAVLILAGFLIVVGLQSVKDERTATCGGGVVQKLYPCPGDIDLRQGVIGASLDQGWTLDLTVDNTPIPQDQVSVQGSDFRFTPGPGTETGALAPGRHTATIHYYRQLDDPANALVYSWAFQTH